MTCVHCGVESTAPKLHICSAAIREWVARWASYTPVFAMLTTEDLIHLQRTGWHLWEP